MVYAPYFMIRFMKKFLSTICMVLISISTTWAYDVELDGIYYNLDKEKMTAEVTYKDTDYYHYSGTIEIPTSISVEGKKYTVTTIGVEAFRDCERVSKVVIPNSVTTIGSSAFVYCSTLSEIVIPNSIDSIGDGAFQGCSRLKSIELPNSLKNIGTGIFSSCYSLQSVKLGNSLPKISAEMFGDCQSLESIEIPESVTTIEERAFSYCIKLANVKIPNSVTSIGGSAFSGCSALKEIVIPNSVTTIGGSAFLSCSALENITFGDNITRVGSSAFAATAWYSNLPDGEIYIGKILYGYKGTMPENHSLIVKEGIVSIADNAFSFCTNLISIKLPESLEHIGAGAFALSQLKNIEIPYAVTRIEFQSFANCNNLEFIKVLGSTPPSIDEYTFSNYEVPLYVPQGSLETYKNTEIWNRFSNIEGFDATGIENIITEKIDGDVKIYTPSGTLVQRTKNYNGTPQLPKGIYVIKQGNISKKIFVK